MSFSDRVESWRAQGGYELVGERRLYVQRREGGGIPLVFLHGFPSSSYDWHAIAGRLGTRPLLFLDFLGFGLSEKPPGHVYTLSWQADAVEELVARAGYEEVFLVAHDMGTSVGTELFARDLAGQLRVRLAGALLFNGSMLLHLASPTPGQKLLRTRAGGLFAQLSTERSFRLQFARIFSAAHPLSAEEAADQWALLAHDGGQRILHRTINYMDERERLTDRWHGALRDWPGALSLAWALEDPVATRAVLDGLRALRPGVPVRELPGIGHYPQLEAPELAVAAIEEALGRAV